MLLDLGTSNILYETAKTIVIWSNHDPWRYSGLSFTYARNSYKARDREDECLFIINYLNGSDFGRPAGRLTSKWRVRKAAVVASGFQVPHSGFSSFSPKPSETFFYEPLSYPGPWPTLKLDLLQLIERDLNVLLNNIYYLQSIWFNEMPLNSPLSFSSSCVVPVYKIIGRYLSRYVPNAIPYFSFESEMRR